MTCASGSNGRARAIESVRASNFAGAVVLYAGNAFTTHAAGATLPGTYLGTQLELARHLMNNHLRTRTTQIGSTSPR